MRNILEITRKMYMPRTKRPTSASGGCAGGDGGCVLAPGALTKAAVFRCRNYIGRPHVYPAGLYPLLLERILAPLSRVSGAPRGLYPQLRFGARQVRQSLSCAATGFRGISLRSHW